MRIAALKLQNFKKFDQKSLEFEDGINVVIGENEAGKTTILNSIIACFYLDPATRSQNLLGSFSRWQEQVKPEIEMEFFALQKKYQLKKDFESKQAEFINQAGKKLSDMKQIQLALSELGLPESQFVYSTGAIIRQKQLAMIESSKDLTDALQKSVMANSSSNITSLIKEVKKRINDLSVGLDRPAKNPGKIKSLRDELEIAKADLSEKKKLWTKVKESKTKGKSVENDLASTKSRIEILEKLIENNKKLNEFEDNLKQLDKDIEKKQAKLTKIKELEHAIAHLREEISSYKQFFSQDLDLDIDKIRTIKAQLEGSSSMLAKLKAKKLDQRATENRGVLLVCLVASIVFGVLGYFIASYFFVGTIVSFLAFVYFLKNKKVTEYDSLKDQKAQLQIAIDQNLAQIAKYLKKYEVKSLDELFSKKIRYKTLKERLFQKDTEYKSMLDGMTLSQFSQDLDKLLTQKRTIELENSKEDIKNSRLSPEEYLSKRRELDSLKINARRIERESITYETRVEDSTITEEDISLKEEHCLVLEEKLQEAEKELKAYQILDEEFEKAKSDIAGSVQANILDALADDLSNLTNGRYQKAKIDKNFNIEVYSAEKKDWVSPDGVLSSGTIDQIYFVYRLALLKLIEGKEKLPLLLDDPFGTFDKKRLEKTRELIENEAKSRQIILFTHSENYHDWGALHRV